MKNILGPSYTDESSYNLEGYKYFLIVAALRFLCVSRVWIKKKRITVTARTTD